MLFDGANFDEFRGKSFKEIIHFLEENGWRLKNGVGNCYYIVNDSLPGKMTIPHPNQEPSFQTIKRILKQAK